MFHPDPLFHRFLSSETSKFLSTFSSHIDHVISGSVMASLFGDLVCLCDSLALIHCNLLFSLQPAMLRAVSSLMDRYWGIVEREWSAQIGSNLFWMKTIYSSNAYRLKSSDAFVLLQSESRSKDAANDAEAKKILLPGYLMEVPILAKAMNDFIGTFNELRFVALRGCGKEICKSLEGHLKGMAKALVDAQEIVKQVEEREEMEE